MYKSHNLAKNCIIQLLALGVRANLHADVVDEGVQIAVRESPEGLHAVGALGVSLVLEPHNIWSN